MSESAPLNAEQLRLVLQTIASRANIARQVLWYSVDSHGAPLAAAAEAAATIMTSIGAIADEVSGANVIGDADCWNFGPDFAVGSER
jgi:hypothetical protein